MKNLFTGIFAGILLCVHFTIAEGAAAVQAQKRKAAVQAGGVPPEVRQKIQQKAIESFQQQKGLQQQIKQKVEGKIGRPGPGQIQGPHLTVNLVPVDQPATSEPAEKAAESPVASQILKSGNSPTDYASRFPRNSNGNIMMDLNEVMGQLRTSSEIWDQIVDPQVKTLIVAKYVELYRQNRVVITKPAAYYAGCIDKFAQENPTLLTNSFDKILLIAAVMDYDFSNGTNKDELAYQILGPELYQQNRQRLGMDQPESVR